MVAATNRSLQEAIAVETFRSDLFYRLNVFPIEMPPLRERREDIPSLVEYFIDRYARKLGKNIRGVSSRTLEFFQSCPWPGNIRELQNVIERSVIMCETENFSVDEAWLAHRTVACESKGQSGTVPGALARNAFPSISDVQRRGVPLTATKAEDHTRCTFREIEMECRVRTDGESRQ